MKLYTPRNIAKATNIRVNIPPIAVVYFSLDLYLNVNGTPKESKFQKNSFIVFI